ncbi:hypothetical protein AVEN_78998-1, partial [Araneus ventricosus]
MKRRKSMSKYNISKCFCCCRIRDGKGKNGIQRTTGLLARWFKLRREKEGCFTAGPK